MEDYFEDSQQDVLWKALLTFFEYLAGAIGQI